MTKFFSFTLAANIEVLGISTGLDAIALALCIRLDSSELESNATAGAVGTKVFTDFWREQLIQCQIMSFRRKEK
jgi:hypothetical protein